jgi:hypothetical protein
MYKLFHIILLFVVITFVFTSCSPIFYQPNTINIPLISEEGEHRFSANYTMGDADGLEMQYAGTIGPNMALMLNGMYLSKNNEGNFHGFGSMIEGGLGFYNPMGKYWSFNLFGGGALGRGQVKNESNNQASFDYNRLFFQPSIGIRYKWFETGLAFRVCGINYTSINNTLVEYKDRMSLNEFSRKTVILIEPGLVIRAGFKNVKVQLSFNELYWLNKPEFSNDFLNYANSAISLGISLRFGTVTR